MLAIDVFRLRIMKSTELQRLANVAKLIVTMLVFTKYLKEWKRNTYFPNVIWDLKY